MYVAAAGTLQLQLVHRPKPGHRLTHHTGCGLRRTLSRHEVQACGRGAVVPDAGRNLIDMGVPRAQG